MIEENVGQPLPPHRVFNVAGGLLAACPITAAQALTLATMIVDLFRELEKLRHETTD